MSDSTSPVPRRVTIATFAVVMLAAAVAQGFGRFTYSVVLPDVREDLLDGSNTFAGLLGTANTFAYLAGALLVGSLARHIRPAGWLRIGIICSASGIVAAARTDAGDADKKLTLTAAQVCECPDSTPIDCTDTCAGTDPVMHVSVQVQQQFNTIFPYPFVSNPIALSQRAQMRAQ